MPTRGVFPIVSFCVIFFHFLKKIYTSEYNLIEIVLRTVAALFLPIWFNMPFFPFIFVLLLAFWLILVDCSIGHWDSLLGRLVVKHTLFGLLAWFPLLLLGPTLHCKKEKKIKVTIIAVQNFFTFFFVKKRVNNCLLITLAKPEWSHV